MKDTSNKIASTSIMLIETFGFSMRPFLQGGEKVIVKKVPLQTLRSGDIIVYQSDNNQKVCHRLVRKVKTNISFLLYARGDAGTGLSEAVTEDMFLGKAVGILRDGRIVSLGSVGSVIIKQLIVYFYPCIRNLFKPFKKMAIYSLDLLQQVPFYQRCIRSLLYHKIQYRLVETLEDQKGFVFSINLKIYFV